MLRRKIFDTMEKWRTSNEDVCLLIEGARQVGKTYAVREFGKKYDSFVEMNFELEPEYRKIFSGNLDSTTILGRIRQTFGKDIIVPGNTLIFFDEIQSCPQARTSLKSLSMNKDVDVIASGSLLGINYKEVSSYPIGYEKSIVMESLDFEEFLWAFDISIETIETIKESIRGKKPFDEYTLDLIGKYFSWYSAIGGMPSAVQSLVDTRDFDVAREKVIEISRGYQNDAAKYANGEDRNRIFDCYRSIPDQLAKEGNRFLYTDIETDTMEIDVESKETKKPRKSKREYRNSINWLIDAGIVLECKRITEPTIPLVGDKNLFKLYMRDTGVLVSLNSRSTMVAMVNNDRKSNRGHIMENCIADMINKAGLPLFYYKNKTTEIDFITEFDGDMVGIEVKSGNNNRSKSLNSAMSRGIIQRGIKLENSNIHTDDHGIEHYPLFAAGFLDYMFERTVLRAE